MQDSKRRALLRGCGLTFQFVAALTLAGGVVLLVGGIATGEWMPKAPYEMSQPARVAVVSLIVVVSVIGLVLGQLTKKGNILATQWATIICWLLFGFSAFHLSSTGQGWDGAGFAAILVVDGHIAMWCAKGRAPRQDAT